VSGWRTGQVSVLARGERQDDSPLLDLGLSHLPSQVEVHEDVVERAQARLDQHPEMMRIRRETAEHPFGTIKGWMGSQHFKMKTLKHVSTEMKR